MSHPRLAQVLGAAFRDADLGSWGRTHHDYPGNGLSLARAMIPDIADRLEEALRVCAYDDGGWRCDQEADEAPHAHDGSCISPYGHAPVAHCHPYEPLVTP